MDRKTFVETLFRPRPALNMDTLSLNPYNGPWTKKEAIHLLRRTTFGFSPDQVAPFVSAGMNGAVNAILNIDTTPPSPPVNIYSTPQVPDPDAPYGTTFINAPLNPALPPEYLQMRIDTVKAWWAGLMVHTPLNIREKMTLFWHNHFAIESDTVVFAQAMYHYLAKLRLHCLGNFKTMTKQVSLEPAMLFYLNGYLNAKAQPDENFARELLELFTVGKGPGSQYTEGDVKAAARVLTGFRINPFSSPISYFFDFSQHDTGNKTFSSFFNNTVITGKFGAAGANELDDLLNMIFQQPEVAKFICRKLYQFFVYYEITDEVEMQIIEPLADIFRNNNYEVAPVMNTLLQSEHFYDTLSMSCVIKTPIDFNIGIARQFKMPFPSPLPNPRPLYQHWAVLTYNAANAGMNILDPPLVAGWPAWYQAPMFHRIWINSDTMAKRLLLINNITGIGLDVDGTLFKLDPIPFTDTLPDPVDPNNLIHDAVDQLFALPISQATRDYYKTFLLGGLDDAYWSTLWITHKANPNDQATKNAVITRLSAMYREMMMQAEFHLS